MRIGAVDHAQRSLIGGHHRVAAEGPDRQLVIELGHGHLGADRLADRTWREHITHLHLMQVEDVGDDTLLIIFQRLLFQPQLCERLDLATQINVMRVLADPRGDHFRQPDQRLERDDHDVEHAGQHRGQLTPVGGTDGLGDDFRGHQDQQRHDRRGNTDPGLAEHDGHLCPHACRTDRMRDGIERQDGGQRLVDVVLEGGQRRMALGVLLTQACHIAWGKRQQRRFQHGADERDADGDGGKENQQKHAACSLGG